MLTGDRVVTLRETTSQRRTQPRLSAIQPLGAKPRPCFIAKRPLVAAEGPPFGPRNSSASVVRFPFVRSRHKKKDEVLVDDFGKLLHAWIAADTKAASAEKRVTEAGLNGQEPDAILAQEAPGLRAIANAAREKVANFVLTDGAGASCDGQG